MPRPLETAVNRGRKRRGAASSAVVEIEPVALHRSRHAPSRPASGSGSSWKIRIGRNRRQKLVEAAYRSAGLFWIIFRTRSLNSGVTSLL